MNIYNLSNRMAKFNMKAAKNSKNDFSRCSKPDTNIHEALIYGILYLSKIHVVSLIARVLTFVQATLKLEAKASHSPKI